MNVIEKLTGKRVHVLKIMLMSLSTLLITSAQASTQVDYSQREDVKQFINQLVVKHGFNRADLINKFSKVNRLDKVISSVKKPAEKKLTWKRYQRIFITEKRIRRGREFLKRHQKILQKAEQTYGVPAEIITAIIGVETFYGKHTGKYTVFDSLTTLGFDYPKRQKFFRRELKEFLLLSKEEDISVDNMTGSYAGAMGLPQFIASSYRHYAVDFDGDGKRDLWHSLPDVIGSVANYFKQHKWRTGETILHPVMVQDTSIVKQKNALKPYVSVAQLKKQGVKISQNIAGNKKATLLKLEGKRGDEYWLGMDNFYVITRYNHSSLYAMAVFQLSERIKNRF